MCSLDSPLREKLSHERTLTCFLIYALYLPQCSKTTHGNPVHAQFHAVVCVRTVVDVPKKNDRHPQSCFIAMVTVELSNNVGTLK